MAVDPRLTGAVIIFQPWTFLMNFSALSLLPIFELSLGRFECGSGKMPQTFLLWHRISGFGGQF